MLRSSYSDNEDNKSSNGNSGEGEDAENSSLVTAELRKEDNGENLASSIPSKVTFSGICFHNWVPCFGFFGGFFMGKTLFFFFRVFAFLIGTL